MAPTTLRIPSKIPEWSDHIRFASIGGFLATTLVAFLWHTVWHNDQAFHSFVLLLLASSCGSILWIWARQLSKRFGPVYIEIDPAGAVLGRSLRISIACGGLDYDFSAEARLACRVSRKSLDELYRTLWHDSKTIFLRRDARAGANLAQVDFHIPSDGIATGFDSWNYVFWQLRIHSFHLRFPFIAYFHIPVTEP